MNKTITLSVAALIISLTAVFGTAAYAQSNQSGNTSMAQKLSEKLGIEESKVQTAFDAVREDRHEEMEGKLMERLNQAVAEGKLTEAQKKLVIERHEALEEKHMSEREQVQSMTQEERRTFMQGRRDEMQQWAEKNGIDFENVMPQQGRQGGRGMHGR